QALPALLKGALKRNEFAVVYEPIVELATGRFFGVEALLRWRRPNGESIRPDFFIPVAEESGLIRRITRRGTQLAANAARTLLARFPDLLFSINLAAADIESPETAGMLRGVLSRAGLQPQNFLVEMTERSLINSDLAIPTLRQLQDIGVRVAIDDFGTG